MQDHNEIQIQIIKNRVKAEFELNKTQFTKIIRDVIIDDSKIESIESLIELNENEINDLINKATSSLCYQNLYKTACIELKNLMIEKFEIVLIKDVNDLVNKEFIHLMVDEIKRFIDIQKLFLSVPTRPTTLYDYPIDKKVKLYNSLTLFSKPKLKKGELGKEIKKWNEDFRMSFELSVMHPRERQKYYDPKNTIAPNEKVVSEEKTVAPYEKNVPEVKTISKEKKGASQFSMIIMAIISMTIVIFFTVNKCKNSSKNPTGEMWRHP